MKKLSYLLVMMSLMLFSVSLQAQTASCSKAQKEACQKVCSESANTGSTGFFAFLANFAGTNESQKVNTSPKASCQGTTSLAVKKVNCNPANCIPENCPPGCKPSDCLPANCKLRSTATSTIAVNLEE